MIKASIRQRLKNGECVFGVFANGLSEELVEILVLTGFDFVMIDSEHACSATETNRRLLMAGESHGGNMFIRVPDKSTSSILHTL